MTTQLQLIKIIIIIIIVIITTIIIWMSLVTGLFCLVLLLHQRWSPPLRLQASHCSTFRIMCDVPSIAVFFSESIECFPGTASKFFFRLLVTIPVAQVFTGIIVHFRFHIRCISIIIIIIIISTHLWLGLPSGLFPLVLSTKSCLRFTSPRQKYASGKNLC